jgi:hypothetical protein
MSEASPVPASETFINPKQIGNSIYRDIGDLGEEYRCSDLKHVRLLRDSNQTRGSTNVLQPVYQI